MKQKVKELIDAIGNKSKAGMHQINMAYSYYDEIYVTNPQTYNVITRRKIQKSKCATCNIQVLNALRIFIDYPSILNQAPNYHQRLGICKECHHHTNHLGMMWCGKPLRGGEVEFHGEKRELCGCNINLKARFKQFKCPIEKWK